MTSKTSIILTYTFLQIIPFLLSHRSTLRSNGFDAWFYPRTSAEELQQFAMNQGGWRKKLDRSDICPNDSGVSQSVGGWTLETEDRVTEEGG